MRKTTAQPISDILKNVVEGFSQGKENDIVKIVKDWPKIVGRKLAAHAQPVTLRREVLVVNVLESAWLYQVSLEKEKLLNKLQRRFGQEKIQNIRFRIGSIKRDNSKWQKRKR